jgi:hypothetical protein
MTQINKIMAELLLKWQEMLQAKNFGEVRAIQEEFAYLSRLHGCAVRQKEFERIRLRFGLKSDMLDTIGPVDHAPPPRSIGKAERRAYNAIARFCINCDTELRLVGNHYECLRCNS